MSRRASVYAREQKEREGTSQDTDNSNKAKVRFPDELVFLDNIKENDMPAMHSMLRRASIQVDINGIGDSGMTPLHQAVVDGNMVAVRLLVSHGAAVNAIDEDTWTPLHAACAQGYAEIARYLLQKGAKKDIATDEGERPIDLVEPDDFDMIRVMLNPNPSPLPEEENGEDCTLDQQDSEKEEEGEPSPPGGAAPRRRRGTAAPPSFHTGAKASDSE